jgi:hypothetical protein
MTLRHLALGCVLIGSAAAAEAKTFVIYTDPMSLSRRMVVVDTPGPDKVLMCMAPPAESGCTEVRARRTR